MLYIAKIHLCIPLSILMQLKNMGSPKCSGPYTAHHSKQSTSFDSNIAESKEEQSSGCSESTRPKAGNVCLCKL